MQKKLVSVIAPAFIWLLSSCSGTNTAAVQPSTPEEQTESDTLSSPIQAFATLTPTQSNVVHGSVTFQEEADGRIRIVAAISGLAPGPHGFHIHEHGDCGSPDASSAGGHFNPHQTEHGKVGEGAHHAGDLPSLDADTDGNARLDVVVQSIVLTGESGIVGRALIVHADPDDYTTQPTGNAGARVACAVIVSRPGADPTNQLRPEG